MTQHFLYPYKIPSQNYFDSTSPNELYIKYNYCDIEISDVYSMSNKNIFIDCNLSYIKLWDPKIERKYSLDMDGNNSVQDFTSVNYDGSEIVLKKDFDFKSWKLFNSPKFNSINIIGNHNNICIDDRCLNISKINLNIQGNNNSIKFNNSSNIEINEVNINVNFSTNININNLCIEYLNVSKNLSLNFYGTSKCKNIKYML